MKIDRFLTFVYIVGTICICVMVYSIIRSESIVARSNDIEYETYDYWEDEYDDTYQSEIQDNSVINSSQNASSEKSSSTRKKTTSSKKVTSKKSSSKKSSSRRTSSKKTSSKKASSKNTSSKDSTSKLTSSKTTTSIPEKYTGIVNLNTATFEQICSLDGIGETLAQNIIDFRNNAGEFGSIEEIMYVNGIGEGKFEQIKDRITVD